MNYLRFHRLKLGKKQSEIAKKARIAQSTYCDYEKGYKKPGAEVYPHLAEALGRPVDELVAKLYGVDPADMVT